MSSSPEIMAYVQARIEKREKKERGGRTKEETEKGEEHLRRKASKSKKNSIISKSKRERNIEKMDGNK